jgi:hypothetical protein
VESRRQRKCGYAGYKGLRGATAQERAVLAQPRAHHPAPPGPAPHQGRTPGAHPSDMPLGVRGPVCRTVDAQATGVGQGLGSAASRLDAPTALGIQRRVVRGDDNVVAQGLSAPGHPCPRSRGLEQEAGLWALGTHRCNPCSLGMDTLREHLAGLCDQTNLTLIFVHIDATMFPGWSPLGGIDRVIACGAYATTSGSPAASSHLSTRCEGRR